MEFLSADWFAETRGVFSGARLTGDGTFGFEFDAGGIRSHLVIDAGRVRVFDEGRFPAADIGLAWCAQDAVRIAWGTIPATEAMARTTMSVPASGARYGGLPAPLGLLARTEADALPELLGASLRVQFVHPGGPFGEFGRVLDFSEGRLVAEQFGLAPEFDVMVKVSLRDTALIGAGHLSVLQALERGGEIAGEIAALATLAAILESPEFKALMLPGVPRCLAMATLGELRADPAVRDGFASVMADTELP